MDSTVHRLVKAYGLDEGLQRARQQGCEPRLVEVARRFYESRGWREDGGRSRSEFPPHPLELRYVLELGAPGRTHP